MKQYTAEELEDMPTLCTGQADSLKIEDTDDKGPYRVWLSRCTVEDGEPYNNKVSVERLSARGGWSVVDEYPG